jgi:predicted phosphohydrolase
MRLWGISDLHLSFSVDKPMEVFGDHWKDHHLKIRKSWESSVAPGDIVLIPGDLSWGMKPSEAAEDLNWIGALPGRKYVCRGNHDYWWCSLSKVARMLPPEASPLQNSAVNVGPVVIAASRGWSSPEWEEYDPAVDERIFRRELKRMELALDAASGLRSGMTPLVYMMHYPPVVDGKSTLFADLLSAAGVSLCAYGHLHSSESWKSNLDPEINGVSYRLISADYLRFAPRLLADFDGEGIL